MSATMKPNGIADSFADVLHAAEPEGTREAKLALYAWLVGHWQFDVTSILEEERLKPVVAKSLRGGCSRDARSRTSG